MKMCIAMLLVCATILFALIHAYARDFYSILSNSALDVLRIVQFANYCIFPTIVYDELLLHELWCTGAIICSGAILSTMLQLSDILDFTLSPFFVARNVYLYINVSTLVSITMDIRGTTGYLTLA